MRERRQEEGRAVARVSILALGLGLEESFERAGRRGGTSHESTAIVQVRDEA